MIMVKPKSKTKESTPRPSSPSRPALSSWSSICFRSSRWALRIVVLYLALILSLVIPPLQKHFIYLHAINFPFYADFENPQKYGLAPAKARNLRFTTRDGVNLGAWHILPEAVYQSRLPQILKWNQDGGSSSALLPPAAYDDALCTHPVVLYLHGNAANRAAPFRIASYSQLSSRLQTNVVAIDYRGFGDSDGTPTEDGLTSDARAAWDWIQGKRTQCQDRSQEITPSAIGADQAQGDDNRSTNVVPVASSPPGRKVIIMGQSLGTGPATALTLQLAREGAPPQALVLLAPYRSLSKLAVGFTLAGFLPVLRPALYMIPFAQRGLERVLKTKFDNEEALRRLFEVPRRAEAQQFGQMSTSPSSAGRGHSGWPHIVINHASNDEVIPTSHGEAIFHEMHRIEGEGRARVLTSNSEEQRNVAQSQVHARKTVEVQTMSVPRWGSVQQFSVRSTTLGRGDGGASDDDDDGYSPTVTLIRPDHGGHNTLGEGVVDWIGQLTQVRR